MKKIILKRQKKDEYLDSCLIFIYNKKGNESFLNEIQKIKPKGLSLNKNIN